jgi:hypothetical protein
LSAAYLIPALIYLKFCYTFSHMSAEIPPLRLDQPPTTGLTDSVMRAAAEVVKINHTLAGLLDARQIIDSNDGEVFETIYGNANEIDRVAFNKARDSQSTIGTDYIIIAVSEPSVRELREIRTGKLKLLDALIRACLNET